MSDPELKRDISGKSVDSNSKETRTSRGPEELSTVSTSTTSASNPAVISCAQILDDGAQPALSEKSERSEKPERIEKSDKTENKSDKSEKSDRIDRHAQQAASRPTSLPMVKLDGKRQHDEARKSLHSYEKHTKDLLAWVNREVAPYGLAVNDLNGYVLPAILAELICSFASGVVFVALLHRLAPSAVDFHNFDKVRLLRLLPSHLISRAIHWPP